MNMGHVLWAYLALGTAFNVGWAIYTYRRARQTADFYLGWDGSFIYLLIFPVLVVLWPLFIAALTTRSWRDKPKPETPSNVIEFPHERRNHGRRQGFR